jgi:hypothetical protein
MRTTDEWKQGKRFFFEKKKQKTFQTLTRPIPERSAQAFESLLLLFFRKEDLASMSRAHCILVLAASPGRTAQARFGRHRGGVEHRV